MELEGHPTHDIVEELERRGAMRYPGGAAGPDPGHLELASRRLTGGPGMWLYLPQSAFDTEIDEEPGLV